MKDYDPSPEGGRQDMEDDPSASCQPIIPIECVVVEIGFGNN